MKKHIYILVILALLVPCFYVSAEEPSNAAAPISAVYDMTSHCLILSGVIGSTDGVLCTVNVTPYSDEEIPFSKDHLPVISTLFTTGIDGAVSEKIPVSGALGGGRYLVYVYYRLSSEDDDTKISTYFNYVNETDPATLDVLAKLNGAVSPEAFAEILLEDHNEARFGIVLEDISENIQEASKIAYFLKSHETGGNYTVSTLKDAIYSGVAASLLSGGASVSELSAYESYLGTTVAEYQRLDDSMRSLLDGYLANSDYTTAKLSKIYRDAFLISSLRNAGGRTKLKEIMTESPSDYGIDISQSSKYGKIPSEYRYKVFDGIYTDMQLVDMSVPASALKAIADSFTRHVDDVYDNLPSGGGGGGGGGNHKNNNSSSTLSSDVNLTNPNDLEQKDTPDSFRDISGHFSEKDVNRLVEMGVVSGYPDGTFQPDGAVTRSEFAKMLSIAFDIKNQGVATFEDVPESEWYAQYVGQLSKAQIITGYDGKFSPDDAISRQDAALMLYRVLDLFNISLPEGTVRFRDQNSISSYALEAVGAMAANQLLKGDGNMFYPQNNITRGETAVLICRVYDLCKGGEAA